MENMFWIICLVVTVSAHPQSFLDGTTTTTEVSSFSPSPYIYGGHEVAPNSLPYVVRIISNFGGCGGSIISRLYVLTARHCIYKRSENLTSVSVMMGFHNIKVDEPGTITHRVPPENARFHPKADAAVVKLMQQITYTAKMQPIRLPQGEDLKEEFAGYAGTASGWGKAENSFPEKLRAFTANVMYYTSCKKMLSYLDPSYICLEGAKKQSICYGDSGGPMVVTTRAGHVTQIGISAFVAVKGCETERPSGYTKVAAIVGWIRDNTDVVFS